MNDTHPKIQQMHNEMMMQKSPEERLLMACEMFSSAKKMIIASLLEDGPKPPGQLRQELFLRLYPNDFSEEHKQKILARLGEMNTPLEI